MRRFCQTQWRRSQLRSASRQLPKHPRACSSMPTVLPLFYRVNVATYLADMICKDARMDDILIPKSPEVQCRLLQATALLTRCELAKNIFGQMISRTKPAIDLLENGDERSIQASTALSEQMRLADMVRCRRSLTTSVGSRCQCHTGSNPAKTSTDWCTPISAQMEWPPGAGITRGNTYIPTPRPLKRQIHFNSPRSTLRNVAARCA